MKKEFITGLFIGILLYLFIFVITVFCTSMQTLKIERIWEKLTNQQRNMMLKIQEQLSTIPVSTPVTILLNDKIVWSEQFILFSGREVTVIANPEGYEVKQDELVYLFQNGTLTKL